MAKETFTQKYWSGFLFFAVIALMFGFVIWQKVSDDSPPSLYYRTQSLFFATESRLTLARMDGDKENEDRAIADYYKVLGNAQKLDEDYDYAMIDIMQAYSLHSIGWYTGIQEHSHKAREFAIKALEKIALGKDAPVKVRTTNEEDILARQKMEREYLARMVIAESYWLDYQIHVGGLVLESDRVRTPETVEDPEAEAERLARNAIDNFQRATIVLSKLGPLQEAGPGGGEPLFSESYFESLNEIYKFKSSLIQPLMDDHPSAGDPK
ncbi:MAG: hypothetical protein NUW37_06140 [Planctomycetes bacterium]|nr:hypothetical protein [Planctomycetota bacterium]